MPVIQKTKYECFSRIVISSEVEKSSLQNDNRRMRESRNTPLWGITPFRHPERSEMSDVRSCKRGTVRTASKPLATYLRSSLLTPDLIRELT